MPEARAFRARPASALVAIALAIGAAPPAWAQKKAVPTLPSGLVVDQGKGKLIDLPQPMTDLFVADPNIADVVVRSPTQFHLVGKKAGETTVSATSAAGVVYEATVIVGRNYSSIDDMLRLSMPGSQIKATTLNGLVLLTGPVASPKDAHDAAQLVQAHVGEGVEVVSKLRSATPLQVYLHVRFAEVGRSFLKSLGVSVSTRDGTGGFQFGIAQGRDLGADGATPGSAGSVPGLGMGTTLSGVGRLLGLDIRAALDLGETTGQVATLAQPTLVALSGETGTFLAGAEVPLPIAQTAGAISVEYKQYGVSLSYTPTVLESGRISMRVRPEVSQLSYSGAVTFNGTVIPALETRRVETTVELGSGQSMVLAGLLQNAGNNTVDRTPWLGQLPVIGALFRSNGFQRKETELVVVITPYLVHPVSYPGAIALPNDR